MISDPQQLPVPLSGFHLIEASAGTGKTHSITDLFVRLLVFEKHLVREILVVTFTEAATKELKLRLRRRLREALEVLDGTRRDDNLETLFSGIKEKKATRALLAAAVTGFDEAAVFTIHGFCRKILQEHCFESGLPFDVELVTDASLLLRETVEDFWRRLTAEASPLFLRYLQQTLRDGRRGLFGPDLLTAFARQIMARPDLKILPLPDISSSQELETALLNHYGRLQGIWTSERQTIASLLADEGLKKPSYPPEKIPCWMSEGDAFFLSGDPLFPWDHLEKFSADSLTAARKKISSPINHIFFNECGKLVATRNSLRELFALQLRHGKKDLIQVLKKDLAWRKELLQVRGFDDLLHDLRAALTISEGVMAASIRSKFPVALIDEFQDTDPIQYDIFRSIFVAPGALLFIIGDPKQAIYGFRGADIFTYMAAAKNAATISLDINWRSAPKLVRGINALFNTARNPFLFEAIRFHPIRPADRETEERFLVAGKPLEAPLRFWFFPREAEEKEISRGRADSLLPEAVAAEIRSLLKLGGEGKARFATVDQSKGAASAPLSERNLEAGDIAVIVRTNREARLIRDALLPHGIPAIIHGSESLFASAEAQDVLRMLRAIAEPGNESLVRAALSTALFGLKFRSLYDLLEEETSWDSWLEKFTAWHHLWAQAGFIPMTAELMNREGMRERLLRTPNGERRLTNLIHCWEVLHNATEEHHLGMTGLVKWFARQVAEKPDREEYQLRLETDDKAVQVITVHRSKGLEFPVVFVPYCWSVQDGGDPVFFHDENNGNGLTLDLGTHDLATHREIMAREELAENMRLLYVAATRAKHLCYLAWGAFKSAQGSAPAFLFHAGKSDPTSSESFPLSWKIFSDEQIKLDLRLLAADPVNGIELAPLPDTGFPGRLSWPGAGEENLVCPTLSVQIPEPWRMSSFSALTAGRREESIDPGPESLFELPASPQESSEVSGGMVDFPRGSRAGLCLHHILEQVDFQASDTSGWKILIRESLRRYRFDDTVWLSPVTNMVTRILSVPLSDGETTFALKEVKKTFRRAEMGFYFPIETFTNENLLRAFSLASPSLGYTVRLKMLPETIRKGFMKGFIDLVFQHRGRYFLSDWKSNYLGPLPADYHASKLRQIMAEEFYFLQYHLYALALHKYLRLRVANYDYENHFGGVFYFFLRGVDGSDPARGLYRDRPSRIVIEALNDCLAGALEVRRP